MSLVGEILFWSTDIVMIACLFLYLNAVDRINELEFQLELANDIITGLKKS